MSMTALVVAIDPGPWYRKLDVEVWAQALGNIYEEAARSGLGHDVRIVVGAGRDQVRLHVLLGPCLTRARCTAEWCGSVYWADSPDPREAVRQALHDLAEACATEEAP